MFMSRLKSVRLFDPLLLARQGSVPRPVVRGLFFSTLTPRKPRALEGLAPRVPFPIRFKSVSASSALRQGMTEHNDSGIEQIQLLDGFQDSYGGVTVEMKEHMDADVFAPLLRASISSWKQQGKQGVWIKLPIEYSHLVDIIVKEGFRYHHAEPNYLMLVRWLAETLDTLPMNASHRVGVGAFVLNDKREVLVVQEHSGWFQGKGVWKLPTGVVNEGEDICDAVVREVKEETGVDTKFVEILCFRQSHKSFFTKSDLLFLCVLQPESSAIDKQNVEIEAAQWMPIEEYAKQPFVVNNEQFNFMANICLVKADHGYPGLSARATTSGGGKRNYIYCNKPEIVENFASLM
ncbi:nudix hydrolase 7 isoform X1 [Eucalyptus grandis]|uniref:nudix hydrolase 7 isoform X1 n=2 Tax=Eucalyptus grandis TaxID=71139 RepID=UPI00192F0D63|nr:nudix hydrolase 7 isoform X1 [Eucalyptus grandis]